MSHSARKQFGCYCNVIGIVDRLQKNNGERKKEKKRKKRRVGAYDL